MLYLQKNIGTKLKEILGITTNEFDKSIMEFEIRDGVYESTQRVYSQEGKSPTLTSAHAEKLVETKPIQVGIASEINGRDILKRVYSPEGKSPTLNTMQGGNREPKVAVEYKAMTEVRTPEANAIRREHKKKTEKRLVAKRNAKVS